MVFIVWFLTVMAKNGKAENFWPDVINEYFQLNNHADLMAGHAIDGNLRLRAELEVSTFVKHARIDRAGGDRAVAEVVGNRSRKLRFDDRD